VNVLYGIAAFLASYAIVASGFYIRGFSAGYKIGRREADTWWIEAGKQVDEARQKIWKENS
jgi:hypothetical protein